jgi:hypothetical protein
MMVCAEGSHGGIVSNEWMMLGGTKGAGDSRTSRSSAQALKYRPRSSIATRLYSTPIPVDAMCGAFPCSLCGHSPNHISYSRAVQLHGILHGFNSSEEHLEWERQ